MAKQPPANIVAYAKASTSKWKVPTSVQLAQWILESAWGTKAPGNNPFGMKPRKGRNDPYQTLKTREVINGKSVYIDQPFRIFPSQAEAFDAHAELLATAPVYAPAMSALPDVSKFIDLMGKRYATDPNYSSSLKNLIKTQGLTKYD